MTGTQPQRTTGQADTWLLGGSTLVAGLLIAFPVAIPVGVGLIGCAVVLLVRGRRRRSPLIVAVVVLAVALIAVALLGIAAFTVTSTTPGVTLIEG